MNVASTLRADARAVGFDVYRILRVDGLPDLRSRLESWLADRFEGDMTWMRETVERRAHPAALWPDVRTIVMLGMNYGPVGDAMSTVNLRGRANISVYARNRDYHDLVKGRLKQLASKLIARAGGEAKVFVDTAPVMEKPLAMQAGLGWQGKHTNLVSREFGSWLFLGSIFTTLDLPPDEPEVDHCGQCRACLDACPTQAFVAPYQLDSRRCVSYLTIEHKGHIPEEFRTRIGNRIYGCDDCLAACPWNKFAQTAHEAKLLARDDLVAPRLHDLASMDEAEFRKHFSGSPIKRIGHARFLRNVLIAIGNGEDRAMAPLAEKRLDHGSPLVRAAAVWALGQLLEYLAFSALAARRREQEPDADVLREWDRIETATGSGP